MENLGHQRKAEEERNPDVDPRLRVMEQFREFFSDHNKDIIMCPKGADSMEVCIKFY